MITRPISKSISRSIALPINDPNGTGFDPIFLFSAGEKGAWYDPSDLSTLFQDAAGTIPVTAAGQPVGRIMDKSGRGNHATQATATSRPLLQTSGGKWYLDFDGVDDGLITGAFDLSTTNKLSVFAGARKQSDATVQMICEASINANANNNSFYLVTPSVNGAANYSAASKGTVLSIVTATPFAAPHTAVISVVSNIAAPSLTMRVNKIASATSSSTQGTGNYGNHPIYIGRRGGSSLPFNGRIFGLIIRGADSTAQQISDTESYMNSKTGAY